MQDRHRPLKDVSLLTGGIIGLFILLQLALLILFGYTPYPDSNDFIGLAADAVKYGEPYPVASKLQELPFIWNVGAINFVALSLKLFQSVKPLLVLYAMMKGASAALLYAITNTLYGRRPALFALLLFVLYPANYGEATCVQSELPFVFFCLSAVWLTVKGHAFAGGVTLALANWIRPMGLVFLLSLCIFLLIRDRRRIGIIIAGYALAVAVIGGASWLRTGRFIYEAKTGWMALLQYSIDNSKDTPDTWIKTDPGWDAVQRDSAWRSQCVRWIISHPAEYAGQMPRKLINTYVSDNVNLCAFLPNKSERTYLYEELSMHRLMRDFPSYSTVQVLTLFNLAYYYSLLLLFAVAAFMLIWRKKDAICVLPLSVVVIGTLVLMFFGHGEARFHAPFMPFIIMLCGVFLALQTSERWKERLG